MRAAVYHGPGDVRIRTVPVPKPGPGEVLVKVAAAGICGTDAAEYAHPRLIQTGPADPVVLGHEFAGEVVAVGPGVGSDLVGQPVTCGAGVSCGACPACQRGRTNLCRTYHTLGFHRDGGLAGYVTAPRSICLPLGDRDLSLDTAALAQPMAIAVHARTRGQVREGMVVLIVGAGGIGAFLTYACAAVGAQVWVADVGPGRLELASALGAARVIDARDDDPATALADAGLRAETIFEVSGSAAGLDSALRAAHPGVRLVAVGVQETPRDASFAEWTLGEYDVLGTVAHVCATDLPTALDLLAEGADLWNRVAPVVLPLDTLVEDGFVPLALGRSPRVKTLFDPDAAAPRAARHTGRRLSSSSW
jgi:(R,R)-butanediol dehydrogenase / meso-butanediol dehydrogenase / diacetyl reductase